MIDKKMREALENYFNKETYFNKIGLSDNDLMLELITGTEIVEHVMLSMKSGACLCEAIANLNGIFIKFNYEKNEHECYPEEYQDTLRFVEPYEEVVTITRYKEIDH